MDAYELALQQARKELADGRDAQRRIAFRVSQLEAIVTQLQALIAKGNANSPSPLFDSTDVTDAPAMPVGQAEEAANWPLWKAIINALNGLKGDFTVPQALKALERNGRTIESRNRLNIIRNTLIQREDIFGRLGTGHYFVRGFEQKKEEDTV